MIVTLSKEAREAAAQRALDWDPSVFCKHNWFSITMFSFEAEELYEGPTEDG